MNKEFIASEFEKLQNRICDEIEKIDGSGKFTEDIWTRPEGGGGKTRILCGSVIEKGGVNFSSVYGKVNDLMRNNTEISADEFFATGVSVVLHPFSPHIPIIHMNVRYFELSNGKYWFGGGIDLTPIYVIPNQAKSFHKSLKNICDHFNVDYYPRFKQWADDYFYLPHRDETRGVGGIFFDHLKEESGTSKERLMEFVLALGNGFSELFNFQVERGKNIEILEEHKKWQVLRRGRYVEFNLLHDRGTKFGLVSGGRTESILMSMPPLAGWVYGHQSKDDAAIRKLLKKDINWLDIYN